MAPHSKLPWKTSYFNLEVGNSLDLVEIYADILIMVSDGDVNFQVV